jgi:anti-sigma regulatory factor (Ser/Thr protein kinase)
MTEPIASTVEGLFEARHAEIARALAFADAFCVARGVDRAQSLRLALILEELFTNTIRHGHRGDSTQPVRIALSLAAEGIDIVYEDSAPAYDPLPPVSRCRSDLDLPVESRRVGGLGLELIVALVDDARYCRVCDRNQLWFRLPGGANARRLTDTAADDAS